MRRMSYGLAIFCISFSLGACHHVSENNGASSDSTNSITDHDTARATVADNALPSVPAGAKVFFRNLQNGQTITSPFKVEMGVTGMSVDSAGKIKAGSGHHHILIDAGDSVATGVVIPADSNHLHFGMAQTSADLKLSPGRHRLTLQFADGFHRSYGKQMAASVDVNVK